MSPQAPPTRKGGTARQLASAALGLDETLATANGLLDAAGKLLVEADGVVGQGFGSMPLLLEGLDRTNETVNRLAQTLDKLVELLAPAEAIRKPLTRRKARAGKDGEADQDA